MERFVVTFSDGSSQLVWAKDKSAARRQMKAYAVCRGVKIVGVEQ